MFQYESGGVLGELESGALIQLENQLRSPTFVPILDEILARTL